MNIMDGKTIQAYFRQETRSMIEKYHNFELLIPSAKQQGADHKGEDGRFIENLIRSYLRKYLPKELEVLTGFIVRPAVKIKTNNRSRTKETDKHSSQLDIIVYNSATYPIYLRSEDTVVVPPEGVICIISVKKTLHDADIKNEINALSQASKLCYDKELREPYLALISMQSSIEKKSESTLKWVFDQMQGEYSNDPELRFDDMVGYIGSLTEWGIFKARPEENSLNTAKYIGFKYHNNEEHMGLQFILSGILSVYYDPSRSQISRPGYTAFISKRKHDITLGEIEARYPARIFRR